MFKLNAPATDVITGIEGMITHMMVEFGDDDKSYHVSYSFQPKGLDKLTGMPLDAQWLPPFRVHGTPVPDVELPFEVLGTEVAEINTGFIGKAIALVLHAMGCVHALVQPVGLDVNGGFKKAYDFDIRRLKGEHVPQFDENGLKKDIQAKPSPMPFPQRR